MNYREHRNNSIKVLISEAEGLLSNIDSGLRSGDFDYTKEQINKLEQLLQELLDSIQYD